MREYGKVQTKIWNSRKFTSLDADGRLLYLYLLTCPNLNSVGCFILKDGYALADLGWDEIRYRKAMDSLCIAHLVAQDRVESLIRIVKFTTHDPFTNPKHAQGGIKLALSLPDCEEKCNLLKELQANKYCAEDEQIAKAIDRLCKPYRNPEPEPEPEPYIPPPPSGSSPLAISDQPEEPKRKRATRLSADWQLTPEFELAAAQLGMTTEEIEREANRFRDYWISKSGSGATKLDWLATWRNWCRTFTDNRRAKNASRAGGQSATVSAAVRAAGAQGRYDY